ncbi:MAG: hypothetical protein ABEI75_00140 [Halobaculum sp.]
MSTIRTSRRLIRESVPLSGILLLWTCLSWVGAEPSVANAFRSIGVVMGAAYVLVRGVQLGRANSVNLLEAGPRGLLLANLSVALAAGVWLFGALLLTVIASGVPTVGAASSVEPIAGQSPLSGLLFATTSTAVGIAGLFAVAAGSSRFSTLAPTVSTDGGRDD